MRYDLYVITDEGQAHGLSHMEIARQALAGGADVIQLRDKAASSRRLLQAAKAIAPLASEKRALFIVNDRLDIALASGAGGVHLGQDDIPLVDASPLVPQGFVIGVTAHTVDEAIMAEEGGADYVALSPIFQTGSKGDAGPACGLDSLRRARSALRIPLIAIGGIGLDNVGSVIGAGADGVAVISAVVGQPDIRLAAKRMAEAVRRAKSEALGR